MKDQSIGRHVKYLSGILAYGVMLSGCMLGSYGGDRDLGTTPSVQEPIAKNSDGRQIDSSSSGERGRTPTIYMVERNVFRFQLGQTNVWDGAVSVLIRNYNLNIADKNSGIITTEWDTYYLDNKLYRNKVSLALRRLGWGTTDLIIYNNIQVLHENSAGGAAAVWLPAKGDQKEIGRLIQNMANHLNQPSPTLPDDMIAMPANRGVKKVL